MQVISRVASKERDVGEILGEKTSRIRSFSKEGETRKRAGDSPLFLGVSPRMM